MKFTIKREVLLKPLSLVAGVVERRQTLPILANVLLVLKDNQLSLTGTDLEVEIVGRTAVESTERDGEITVPARKLLDITKSLPDGSLIEFSQNEDKVSVKSGRSRYTLSSLAASDFPNVEEGDKDIEFRLKQGDLKHIIERTSFAMAQQDVRYYLNGMLWELQDQILKVVATDGHRLALSSTETEGGVNDLHQVIMPRKGVNELVRLLMDEDEMITVALGSNHIRATTQEYTFTTKLVDGKFPDYQRVIPKGANKEMFGPRAELKNALSRAAILSNEKYRGVRLQLRDDSLTIVASNPEQEEAEETCSVDYQGDDLEIGFNVNYLIDALNVLTGEVVKLSLSDSNSSALLEEADGGNSYYVIMPMRL